MKKRLLSALLALCMVLTMAPAVAFAADGDTGNTGRGANLEGISVGALEDAQQVGLSLGVNINKTGAANMVYNIGEDTVLMISGQDRSKDDPVVFENCTFNLSGGTVSISGNQDGISYNNGDTITKLWIGGNVQFENCKFVTEPGATKTTSAGNDACSSVKRASLPSFSIWVRSTTSSSTPSVPTWHTPRATLPCSVTVLPSKYPAIA